MHKLKLSHNCGYTSPEQWPPGTRSALSNWKYVSSLYSIPDIFLVFRALVEISVGVEQSVDYG